MGSAMNSWVLHDPAGLVSWLAQANTTGSEFDQVLETLIVGSDSLVRPTAQALSWAEGLADETLRFQALDHVVREWADKDPAGARQYLERSALLTPDQQQQLRQALAAPNSEA